MKSLPCWEQTVWENYRRTQKRDLCSFGGYRAAACLVRQARFLTQSGLFAPVTQAVPKPAMTASPQVEHRLYALFAD